MAQNDQTIYIGLSIENPMLINQIDILNKKLISQGIDPRMFVPLNRIHISLVQLRLTKNILNNKTFKNVKKIIENSIKSYKNIYLKSHKYHFGEVSQSIKIYLDQKANTFISKLRNEIILMVKSIRGINFLDERSFVPHISLSYSNGFHLLDKDILNIENSVSEYNNLITHKCFAVKSINMLLPQSVFFKNEDEKMIFEKAKQLSINLY